MSLVQWNQSEHCLSSFFEEKKTDMKLETQSILINSNQFQSIPMELELKIRNFEELIGIGIGIEQFLKI